jgi:hypothetical protein
MREIKFRAWDKITKRIYNVRMIDFDANGKPDWIRLIDWVQISEDTWDYDFPEKRFDEYELMQYTGLKDKNGKEIFEGDILQFEFEGENILTCPVSWEKNLSMWKCGISLVTILPEDLFVENTTYEIVGNIYENPELLKDNHE